MLDVAKLISTLLTKVSLKCWSMSGVWNLLLCLVSMYYCRVLSENDFCFQIILWHHAIFAKTFMFHGAVFLSSQVVDCFYVLLPLNQVLGSILGSGRGFLTLDIDFNIYVILVCT